MRKGLGICPRFSFCCYGSTGSIKCHLCWAGEVGEKSGPGWKGGEGGEEAITSAPGPQTAALATEAECLPGAPWMRPSELSRRVTPAALPVVFVSGPLNSHHSSLAGYGQYSSTSLCLIPT